MTRMLKIACENVSHKLFLFTVFSFIYFDITKILETSNIKYLL